MILIVQYHLNLSMFVTMKLLYDFVKSIRNKFTKKKKTENVEFTSSAQFSFVVNSN